MGARTVLESATEVLPIVLPFFFTKRSTGFFKKSTRFSKKALTFLKKTTPFGGWSGGGELVAPVAFSVAPFFGKDAPVSASGSIG